VSYLVLLFRHRQREKLKKVTGEYEIEFIRQGQFAVHQEYTPCWDCGYSMDTSAELSGEPLPAAGVSRICVNCGALSVFTGLGLTLRAPTIIEEQRFWRSEWIRAQKVRRPR
jgi:hypothetical protein